MDGIELLKREALIRRNAKILAAKREYHNELKAIRALGRTLGVCVIGRPRKVVVTENPLLKPMQVARAVLMEGKAMTVMELAVEAQRRGCRSADDIQLIAHAIRAGLNYHRRHFKRDGEGRWVRQD
jgi:hypothetical protein